MNIERKNALKLVSIINIKRSIEYNKIDKSKEKKLIFSTSLFNI